GQRRPHRARSRPVARRPPGQGARLAPRCRGNRMDRERGRPDRGSGRHARPLRARRAPLGGERRGCEAPAPPGALARPRAFPRQRLAVPGGGLALEEEQAEPERFPAAELAVARAAVRDPLAQLVDPLLVLVRVRVALAVSCPGVLVGIPVFDAARDGALEIEAGLDCCLDRPLVVLELLPACAEGDEILGARLLAPVALAEQELAAWGDKPGEDCKRPSHTAPEGHAAGADDEVEGARLRRVLAHVLLEEDALGLGHPGLGLPAR